MIIKKYYDRRLYNTTTRTFVTLKDVAEMVRQGMEFAIHETESGKDITRSVLLHIIVERERKATQNLLPTAFLRQLIRFYGHSMQMIVPVFLDVSLRFFIREQEKLRHPAISASSQETEMESLGDFARDLGDPCRHGGAVLRRQRGALAEAGVALLPKLGEAGAPRSRLGILPRLVMIAPKCEQVEPLLLGEIGKPGFL